MSELAAAEQVNLAIDTSDKEQAEHLVDVAEKAGARFVKMGLELSSTTSWEYCSNLTASFGMDWVADAKLHDIPNTVAGAVRNLKKLQHPPFGITMHTLAGFEAMRVAQEEAEGIKMLGVTILTSIEPAEVEKLFHETTPQVVQFLAEIAVEAGLKGIVCSPQEVGIVKSNPVTSGLFAMIPGTRSTGAEVADQVRVGTPTAAIKDGADLLVIGRQITQAEDPALAFQQLVAEIEGARGN